MSAPGTCRLPPELVLQVLDSLVPPSDTVALHLSDPAAKTIHAFTRVSRLTYATALRHLYSRCLSIDSENRLRLLLLSLESFTAPCRSEESSLPHVEIKPLLTSLYLAPFPPHSIDSQPIAQWCFELLSFMQFTLRRLVVDIPFHTMAPHMDHLSVFPKLNTAFDQLWNVEEFVSCGSFPNLWWTLWPCLRKLALTAISLEDLNDTLSKEDVLEDLECMLLANPSFSTPSSRRLFFHRTAQSNTSITILHQDDDFRAYWSAADRWLSMGMGELAKGARDHRDECLERFCLPRDHTLRRDWLLKKALQGELWEAGKEQEPPIGVDALLPESAPPTAPSPSALVASDHA
ncbi:hypothetical protein SLS58_003720 [Diplodia intermedia]|uniref:Uncharacterized protein n=1 Tax=Diplodia intermedia TaxID=856260 RepID=A0ABR3TVA7_9PEZI